MMSIKSRLKKIKVINKIVIQYKCREQRKSYGQENPDKTFFVIRRNAPAAGLFSFVTVYLGWIRYALDKGYIPVADMCSAKNTYLTEEEVGKKNAWEFYFEQPCGYSLTDISHSKNVILSNTDSPPAEYPGHNLVTQESTYCFWHEFAQAHLKLQADARSRMEQQYHEMFGDKKVLGILCRGTDYKNLRPSNHPVQPELSDIMDKAEEVFRQYHCDCLYLATEDNDYLQKFKERFGEKLHYLKTERFQDTGLANINLLGEQAGAQTPAKRGMDYLTEIGILAKCHCLVAGSVGGTYGALLLNEAYEYRYIYDLGLYP